MTDDWKTTAALLDGLLAGVAPDPDADPTEPEVVRKVRNLLRANERLGAHALALEVAAALERAEQLEAEVELHRSGEERLQQTVAEAVGLLGQARTEEARLLLLDAVAAREAPLEPPATPGPVRCPRCGSDGVMTDDSEADALKAICCACGHSFAVDAATWQALLRREESFPVASQRKSVSTKGTCGCGQPAVVVTADVPMCNSCLLGVSRG